MGYFNKRDDICCLEFGTKKRPIHRIKCDISQNVESMSHANVKRACTIAFKSMKYMTRKYV